MKKSTVNYVLDGLIGLAFLLSALSGVLLWLGGSGGYQGGRNPGFETVILGIDRWAWSDLHVWSSVVMVAGVLLHLVLHWQWIVCVTKNMLRANRSQPGEVCPVS